MNVHRIELATESEYTVEMVITASICITCAATASPAAAATGGSSSSNDIYAVLGRRSCNCLFMQERSLAVIWRRNLTTFWTANHGNET